MTKLLDVIKTMVHNQAMGEIELESSFEIKQFLSQPQLMNLFIVREDRASGGFLMKGSNFKAHLDIQFSTVVSKVKPAIISDANIDTL
jgi:hypothetical protein